MTFASKMPGAEATSSPGNGGRPFGGPAGSGLLTLNVAATTLSGTIAASANGTGHLFDEFVIYLDSKPGGFANTSTFTDQGNNGGDVLRKVTSGFAGGSNRQVSSFTSPFAADFTIAISPTQGRFGTLLTLTDPTNFFCGTDNMNGNANFTPTGNGGGPYTLNIPLSLIGVAPGGRFNFSTSYLNTHTADTALRSNEGRGNVIAFAGGTNDATAGFTSVPEPGTASLLLLGIGGVVFMLERRSFQAA